MVNEKQKCYKCKEEFPIDFLPMHIKGAHILGTQSRHPCDKCHRSFIRKSHLHRHVRTAHLGVRYNCQFCKHTSTQQTDLRKHLMVKHNIGKDGNYINWDEFRQDQDELIKTNELEYEAPKMIEHK